VRFDPLIHQPTRLRIMAYLAGLGDDAAVEFGALQEALDLTEGNLSRHLSKLEEAVYLRVIKGYEKRRPRTWVQLSGSGRAALNEHLRALEEIARQARYAKEEA
jgi:DNA-binding MarR family transcriptional regulator